MSEINEIRERRKAETKAVKAALIAAGFKGVSVKHGRGTAWGWLDIWVDGAFSAGENTRVQQIAAQASGRSAYAAGNISINFNRVYDAPAAAV